MEPKLKSNQAGFIYGILLASTASFFGTGVGTFNTFFDHFIKYAYNITDERQKISIVGTINFMFMFGGMTATIVGGYFYEKYGRWKTLIALLVSEIVILLLMGIASIELLFVLRFVEGFIGCYWTLVAPLMIKENLPFHIANRVAPLFYVFLTGFILIGYCFGSEWSGQHWRFVLMYPLLIEIPKLYVFYHIYKMESPIWLYNNQRELVRENFKFLYEKESAEKLTEELGKVAESTHTTSISFGQLLSAEYLVQFFLGSLLNVMNQMTGVNFLIFYSTRVFQEMGLPSPSFLTMLLGFTNFSGGFFLIRYQASIGKRYLLTVGILGQAFAYLVFLLGVIFKISILVLVGPFVFMFCFSISLGGIIYSYTADVVPPFAVSICALFQWVLACGVTKFGVNIIKDLGIFWVFFICLNCAFYGGIVFYGFSIETNNKSDLQIKKEFMHKRFFK